MEKTAKWISLGKESTGSVLLRKSFTINDEPLSATLEICGLGWYLVSINSSSLTDGSIAPLETDYKKRIIFDEYDVTDKILVGKNVIVVELGNGRYETNKKKYGRWQLTYNGIKRLCARITIILKNGEKITINADESWKCDTGNSIYNCLYDGSTIDLRNDKSEFFLPTLDEASFDNAVLEECPCDNFELSTFKIKVTDKIEAIKSYESADGTVFDFGQNLTGWASLDIANEFDDNKITVRYAELLNEDGTLNTQTNNRAINEDIYFINKGKMTLAPKFTFHGFQYISVTSNKEIKINKAVMNFMHADVENSGKFMCSDKEMNRLHEVINRTQKCALFSYPIDCPQRDERLPWMGDAHITMKTALYNFELYDFYKKWTEDIRLSQYEDGAFPVMSPFQYLDHSTPEWCIGCSIIARDLYDFYGDVNFIKNSFFEFCTYADYLISKCEDYEHPPAIYGDWCSNVDGWDNGQPAWTSTLFVYYHLDNIKYFCSVLGIDFMYADFYNALKENIKNKYFERKSGKFADGSQFANAIALKLGILNSEEERKALSYLVDVIEKCDYGIYAGIIGVRYMFDMLSKFDRPDVLWKILHKKEYPSYINATKNRSTLPEFWEGFGSGKHGLYGSGSHCMFGSIDAFFFEDIAGIRAFGELVVKPYFPEDLNFAYAKTQIKNEKISVSWERENNVITFNLTKPNDKEGTFVLRREYSEKILSFDNMQKIFENENGVTFKLLKGTFAQIKIKN